ncbi:MAG: hypothetical protein LBE91_22085 [Tannerella sp.]|nr:hypothetical protein [Tannerella sp.]
MRQSNESFLSLYRLSINEVNRNFSPKTSGLLQCVLDFFFIPLTHEEGHRSILTNEQIGSISRPYFNKNLAAYVSGVTNQQLIDLRSSNLPVFRRMYTAGLESDYSLLLREKSLLSWNDEEFKVLWLEYFVRKFSLVSYYAMGLFNYNSDLREESNELNRDIAGFDVYGAIRALHNPAEDFQRYVDYRDLSPEEKDFVKRVGWRSLINLIDPTLILGKGFHIKDKYLINFNLGYTMSPFGDFMDEHVWLKTQSLKSHLYFRQYQNKENWFPAVGIEVADIKPFKNFISSVSVHGWSQPKDFSFTQKESMQGGAIDLTCKYRFPVHNESRLKGISINLGLIAKTKGFLPEEVEMDKHFGVRIGTSIWLK